MYVVLVWMLLPRSHIPRALGTRVHVEPNRAYVPPPYGLGGIIYVPQDPGPQDLRQSRRGDF